ncbi:putative SOS response-associated peptidase YedK [Hamadaea flava]|uniref:Abasic site processing protein n=1 Tax=Hamadaea flava TaxID=1742688 RepID=A0ABV8LLM0_9ACTN|nr:SOS response-associated peptidase [Hamadaea flava]MCP2323662.1 putative SOS response-associated peptidase YedK [Hamadaea flava]
MCGRYANARTKTQIALDFQVAEEYVEVKDVPDYNVTPQKRAPIVLTAAPPGDRSADAIRQVRLALWGLRPGFLKPEQRGFANARVEGLAEKRSFAKPLRESRILVPMDGFFEWWEEQDESGKSYKQPYYFTPKDGEVLALAGLMRWAKDPRNPDEHIMTYTIITTEATDDVGLIHDRMPMIIRPSNWSAWLDPAMTDADTAQALMAPPGEGALNIFKVPTAVNNARNNGPQLIEPIEQLV